jgi:hypothetical protein
MKENGHKIIRRLGLATIGTGSLIAGEEQSVVKVKETSEIFGEVEVEEVSRNILYLTYLFPLFTELIF